MEIVVRVVLAFPDWCRVGTWLEDSQEQVDCVLLLRVRHRVGVVPLHRLHDVVALARPRRLFSVGLDPVDQLRTTVLDGESVPVVFVHLLKHPYTVAVCVQPG